MEVRSSPLDLSGLNRVLHFITSLDYSGAPKGVFDLMREQERLGLVAPSLGVLGSASEMSFSAKPRTLLIMNEDFSARRPVHAVATAHRLARFVRANGFELIHSHLPSANAVAAMAAAIAGVPNLAHIRGMPPWFASLALRDRYRKAFLRLFLNRGRTRFVSVSRQAADYFRTHLLGNHFRIDVVSNGVDLDRFRSEIGLPEGRSELILGGAGRFSEEKNFELLIRALAILHEDGCSLALRLAGEGGRSDAYRALARELGIADRVEFCGVVDDMAGFYRGLDIFVLTSRTEGLPRVLIEASASGVPIVATAVGGTPELVSDGVTGLLVPSDDLGALVAALRRLVDSPPLRERLSGAAKDRVNREFSVERVAEKVQSIYGEMLAAHRLRHA